MAMGRFSGASRALRASRVLALVAVLTATAVTATGQAGATAGGGQNRPARVDVATPTTSAFDPGDAFGEGIDGGDPGRTASALRSDTVAAVRRQGLRPLSYRLRTELGVEAWHWGPAGRWSDPARRQGYWTSDVQAGTAVQRSTGYRLPRRGSTNDQAANDGWSRLDDGDPATFWKSNPYLDERSTGEPEPAHAQWALLDLGRVVPVDAVRLSWGTPWATELEVQRWDGEDPVAAPSAGRWVTFPAGHLTGDGGGDEVRTVAPSPLPARFVRLLLLRSSHIGPASSTDRRDAEGFAIREVGLGTRAAGRLVDAVRHGASVRSQSVAVVSSTDPWHRASDLDPGLDQPGIDAVAASGLLQDRPLLVAVPLLYGTPDDAVALLRHLQARSVPIRALELGEEPDGQLADPEDVGALHSEWVAALRSVDPSVRIGGPSLQSDLDGWQTWPDANGSTSWPARYATRATAKLGPSALSFVSFEWYPVDDVCADPARQLAGAPRLLDHATVALKQALPPGTHLIMSELGWSSYAARAEVELPGALLVVDAMARFAEAGGEAAYLYGAFPDEPINEATTCHTWGNLMTSVRRSDGGPGRPMPVARLARLLTGTWAPLGPSELLAVTTSEAKVTAHAVRHGDGTISLLLLNLDLHRAHRLIVTLDGGRAHVTALTCFGPAQYTWHGNGPAGHPSLNRPPVLLPPSTADGTTTRVAAGTACVASLTVR